MRLEPRRLALVGGFETPTPTQKEVDLCAGRNVGQVVAHGPQIGCNDGITFPPIKLNLTRYVSRDV